MYKTKIILEIKRDMLISNNNSKINKINAFNKITLAIKEIKIIKGQEVLLIIEINNKTSEIFQVNISKQILDRERIKIFNKIKTLNKLSNLNKIKINNKNLNNIWIIYRLGILEQIRVLIIFICPHLMVLISQCLAQDNSNFINRNSIMNQDILIAKRSILL
jgi:hypothetical protein